MLTRRALLTAMGTGALGWAAGCGTGGARELTVAAGEPGGFYLEFAQLLAREIPARESSLRVRALATEGSRDNLRLLSEGRADLALTLVDSAQVANGHPDRRSAVRAVGRVYENYLQLVVLEQSPIHTVADLAGRTVSAGAAGSGAELTARRVMQVAGLHTEPGGQPVTVRNHPFVAAIAALEAGQIDALFWSGGVPTPALAALAKRRRIRLLPMNELLPALRRAYNTAYELVSVPADSYDAGGEVVTVGVANLVVCRPELDAEIVDVVTRTLVTHAARLVPEQALGTQFLDPRSLIVTSGIPLHPGAMAAYRSLHG
ncbi:TAXI family TRAP transporter solute-binding subunit [Pseudonocardia eucalypti]|uniref:TAXI family TRAP transporter solute-binding subunit n=1 Tax=Pseudonocardia eucalypti TaxID=648755 RepID=A0ABP9QDZ1_9PSEU|nr:TRAP transporter TAXI family solute receptor [Pseudonocardia eucalypti]